MEKSNTIKLSLVLSVFSLFVFSFTYFGSSAYGSRSASSLVFSEQTFIGTLDVSGKSHEAVKSDLEEKISGWTANADIKLVYKEKTYAVASSDYVFLIDESIASAVNGTKNELIVELKKDILDDIITTSANVISYLDTENLEKELLEAGKNFVKVTAIGLESYLPEEKPESISTATIQFTDENHEAQKFIEVFSTVEVAAKSPFSLSSLIDDSELTDITSNTYNLIAAAIYRAILPTNFTIGERHISSQQPEKVIELGYEAKVDLGKKMDLMFYNPNDSAYSIEFEWNEPNLEVSVIGIPLLYEYKIIKSDIQEFKPRTITQFSPLLKQGQKSIEQEGEPGVLVKVFREIYAKEGGLLKTEMISEDFYPPVHRVEVHAIPPAAKEKTSSPGGGTDTVTVSPVVQNGPDHAGTSDTDPAPQLDSGSSDSSGDNEDEAESVHYDDGGLWGKPDEQPK